MTALFPKVFHKVSGFFQLFSCTPSFLLLLAWLNFMDRDNILPMALFACLCHEWGHYCAILCCAGQVERIHCTIVGAEMQISQDFSYLQELVCALAGPMMNLLLALLFCHDFPLFAGINLALALVNLLPISKLDGGRALGCFCRCCFPLTCCGNITSFCDFFCASFLLLSGLSLFLHGGSVTLLILSLWLLWSIQQ